MSEQKAVAHVVPGGRFVFIDLFGDSKFYPDSSRIEAAAKESGGEITEQRDLGELMPMPFPLRHKRVLGGARLIAGRRGDG